MNLRKIRLNFPLFLCQVASLLENFKGSARLFESIVGEKEHLKYTAKEDTKYWERDEKNVNKLKYK